MRIIAKYRDGAHPPLLILYIHDAPHRRQHVRVIQQYREALRSACTAAGIETPIDHDIDLSVLFVNPSSPDLGNSYLALEQALDGSTLKGPGILTDDSLISSMTVSKIFPHVKAKRQPVNLPRFVTLDKIA